jgi:glyoxylate/hydroxypyruvate reductase A
MGLGEMGGRIAAVLPTLGYAVNGWSRTPRTLPDLAGYSGYSGAEGLQPFLARTDVLVCLLPLTEATRGILAKPLFDALPHGAALVHCGRGEHLVEGDLLEAMASQQLRGAVLDVYAQEPLPAEHPFWITPGIVVTPHMATMASNDSVAAQIARNVAQLRAGAPLFNTVDVQRGY